ncbi:MAG TPA: hypothetical protein VGB54_06715, partial [Allosphingosinicella sp.]
MGKNRDRDPGKNPGKNRTTFILATIGAAATGYLAVVAYRRMSERGGGRAPAMSEREQHVGG